MTRARTNADNALADITGVTASTGLTGTASSGTATLSIDSTVATLTGSQTLTNKTIDAANNTLTGLVTASSTDTLTNKTLTTPKITLTYSAKTDNYTFASGDEGNLFSMNASTAKEFRIPTDATFNFGIGTQFNVFWITGTGQPLIVASTPGTTTVISTGATSASPKLRVANSMATCIKISANNWIVIGDIA